MSEDSLKKTFQEGDIQLKKAYKAFYKKHYAKAKLMSQKARELFIFTQSSLREAECLQLMAEIEIKQKNWMEVTQYYQTILELQKVAATPQLLARTYYNLALSNYFNKDFDASLANSQQSLDYSDKITDIQMKLNNCTLHAKIYLMMREYNSSLFYLNLAQEELQANSKQVFPQETKIYPLFGVVYEKIHDYPSSIDMYIKSIEIYEKRKIFSQISGIQYQLSKLYFLTGNQKSALKHITQAISIRKSLKNGIENPNFYQLLIFKIKIAIGYGLQEEAQSTCENLIEISEEYEENSYLIQGLLLMAQISLNFEDFTEKNQKLISNYLTEAKDLANTQENFSKDYEIALTMSIFIEKTKSIPDALDYLNQFDEAKEKGDQLAYTSVSRSEILEKIGIYHYKLQNIAQANQTFLKAETFLLNIEDQDITASLYYNIACSMYLLHLPNETLAYLKQAFKRSPRYKVIAMNDPDLAGLVDSKRFGLLLD